MKKVIIFALIFATTIIAAIGVKQGLRLYNYKKLAKSVSIDDLDISTIKDGSYTGQFDMDYVFASVSVTITKGQITKIDFLKLKQERGQNAETIIPAKIISQQSVSVDVVTGASNSSRTIMKAVENALKAAK